MTQVVWVIWGKNKSKDYHFQHTASALIEAGVVSWLEVTVDSVSIWSAFIEVARTGWATFKVPFFSSEVETIVTWINQKIFIEIWQTNIDDGDLNNSVDWTWIGTITVAASFPSGNYIPLASSDWSWVITDLRVFIEYKKALQNLDWITGDVNTSWDIIGAFLYWDWSNITGLQAEVSSTSNNYMLWATWTVWLWYSLVDYEQLWVWTSNDVWTIAQPEAAQSFYAQNVDIVTLPLMIRKFSSPSDNILLEIQTDNAGVPSGTVVTNWTSNNVAWTGLTTSFVETTFTFASVPVLTEATLYHIVVKRSGADDAVNYYWVESNWSSNQIGTASLNTGTWANATDDLYFKMPTGYKLVTLWGTDSLVCQLAWTEWQIRKFNRDYDNNQSGLVKDSYYWFHTTTGVLTLWIWVLRALSETEINITIIKKTSVTDLWLVEMCTDSEASNWTDEERFINSKQAKDNYKVNVVSWDILLASLPTTEFETSTTYVKAKEIQLDRWWIYDIEFQMNGQWWLLGYARIYVNWIAVWIERSNLSASYITYNEDITVADWDLVQLYLKADSGGQCRCTAMEVSYKLILDSMTYTINDD